MIRQLFIWMLRGYRWVVSPVIHFIAGPGAGCRFEPSCSRYGIEAACAPIRVTDVFNSNFLTGDIRLTDGAWAIYRTEDLQGGPCPTTTLEPRQPGLYLETITQKGDFFVQMSVGDFRVPIQPQVKLVQAVIFANKPGIALGGTYAAAYGPRELLPIFPADLQESFDQLIYGEMRFSWAGHARPFGHR